MTNTEFLSQDDFDYFKAKIFELAGIHLTEKKVALVQTRLQSFLRKSEIKSTMELKQRLEQGNSKVVQAFINLLTTNKTDFFREPQHFDFLVKSLLPYWQSAEKKEIKIWCSACSTGEEPYTLAMLLATHMPQTIRWSILATDIDTEVLKTAKNGVYPVQKKVEISEDFHKHLVLGKKHTAGWFKIADELHQHVQFESHNLIDSQMTGEQIFDLILCRNVLIYFERNTIMTLMSKFHNSLRSDGFLFIGHSESIQGTSNLFKSMQPSIFKKISA